MKRPFFVSVIVSLLVAVASISWAETTTVKDKDPKSNTSDRVEGSGKSKGKVAKKSTAAPATQGQQDPCASVKNDPVQFAKCQDAAHPAGSLPDRSGRRRGY